MSISWNEPTFGEKELELVKEVLESGYVSEGPKTKELEEKLAEIIGCKHVIMTTSCTAALWLAIEADKKIKGYNEGEVAIPDLTFVATKNAVDITGLTPYIKDVDSKKYMMEKNGSYSNNVVTIIPVNLIGRRSQFDGMDEVVNENDVDGWCSVICDNAGCIGSNVPIGKVGCYSLQGNKIISCGQGGFCATDDDEYAKKIRQLKDFGREDKDDNDTIGFNLKFNDILAAVTLGQLKSLTKRKVKLVNQYLEYREELCKYGEFIDFDLDNGEVPLWVEFKTDKRDELFEYLKEKGISCRKPWKAIMSLPNAKEYEDTILWLPNGQTLTEENQKEVIKEIKEFYNGIK